MIEDLTELFNFGKIAYVVKQFTISYLCVHCFCILQVQFYFLHTNMEKYFLWNYASNFLNFGSWNLNPWLRVGFMTKFSFKGHMCCFYYVANIGIIFLNSALFVIITNVNHPTKYATKSQKVQNNFQADSQNLQFNENTCVKVPSENSFTQVFWNWTHYRT